MQENKKESLIAKKKIITMNSKVKATMLKTEIRQVTFTWKESKIVKTKFYNGKKLCLNSKSN